ncbi:hypothetical protein M408DRAFT_328490 [Serendipita vermifera MAFF 305830]|uniref:DRBM domain-containing protein n=1 Tax=Serendipita vermifera MAFF 305830 TaxID=933852 RepID=A0A0C3BDC3_SERVB|nr:hypothetical protein M408DRAFT_328490 [Serendipita vermifera MAFF 305830]
MSSWRSSTYSAHRSTRHHQQHNAPNTTVPAVVVKNSQVLNEVLQRRRYTTYNWVMSSFNGPDGSVLHQATFMFADMPPITSPNYHRTKVAAKEEAATCALPIVRNFLGL